MSTIPTYALYGERPEAFPAERMHCESIAARSRLYEWEIAPHRHAAFFQILYLRGGRATALLEGERLAARPPCVITVPALAAHGFAFSRDIRGHVFTIVEKHLESLLTPAQGLFARFATPRVHALGAARAEVGRLLESAAAEFAANAPWRLEVIRASLALALMRIARASASAAPDTAGPAGRKMRHVRRFGALVDRWYREHRGVPEYAAAIGITPTQLNRVCRELLGTSALGAISRRVVLEAERDLIYTTIGVKQIALSLGFTDEAYFTRFFTRRTGSTPTAFRAAAHRRLARERHHARDARRAKP